MNYIIKPIVCDYGVIKLGNPNPICICNIKRNAELIADILNGDSDNSCAYSYEVYPDAKYKVVKAESVGQRITREEIETMKYSVCCPMCDNSKCVRGTDDCEAEIWAKIKAESEDIEDAPTIQAVPQWIPVSERLPEEGQRVLVTQIVGERTVVYCTTFPFEKIKEKYITAWMPLPKSYKPDRNTLQSI